MAATVTLSTTTLPNAIGASEGSIKVASTSGMLPGVRLFADAELMRVISLGVSPWVNVQRGVDGTAAMAHASGSTLYLGRADQFYDRDPVGLPPSEVPVNPWINAPSGAIWFASGDETGSGINARYWERQTVTRQTGALGVRTSTTSSAS